MEIRNNYAVIVVTCFYSSTFIPTGVKCCEKYRKTMMKFASTLYNRLGNLIWIPSYCLNDYFLQHFYFMNSFFTFKMIVG